MKPELFSSLKGYKKNFLLNDILAGLIVAIIAMPLSIALGIQTFEGTSYPGAYGVYYGIVTAIIAGFFIATLGGSKFQIGGPTAAFVVILNGYLSNPEIGLLGLAFAGVMAGIILIVMGLLKLGKVMKIFPYPISIGFTTGIGITLIVGQLKDFCGFSSSGANVIQKVGSIFTNISSFNLGTFIVAFVGLIIVVFLPKINKKIPPAFVALIICTLLCLLINNVCGGSVDTIGKRYGEISAQFVLPEYSSISTINFAKLIVPAIIIALLCAIESLLSATVACGMTNTTYDANQELIGQGVANIFSSLFGGLPATGAIARTAANIENKAKSPLSGIFHAIFVLIMYFLLMGVLKYVPLAVFSAILISVAINMSKFPYFVKLCKFSLFDTIILITTCALTVVFDLTYGVLGAFALASILNIYNIIHPIKINSENQIQPCGSLYFINAQKFISIIQDKYQQSDNVVINFDQLVSIDLTAFEKLIKLKRWAEKNNKTMEIINPNQRVKSQLEKFEKII